MVSGKGQGTMCRSACHTKREQDEASGSFVFNTRLGNPVASGFGQASTSLKPDVRVNPRIDDSVEILVFLSVRTLKILAQECLQGLIGSGLSP